MSKKSELPDRNEWFIPEQKADYEKYIRGADDEELIDDEIKAPIVKNELIHHKEDVTFAARSAARSEMLRTEEKGYIESKFRIKERDILKQIPTAVASQQFDFKLPKGPYCVDVTRDGRHILFGGKGKHLAQFDRYDSRKMFEISTDCSIRDVCFLQNDTLNAAATSKNLFIYDKAGTQIHEIKQAKNALGVQFLSHHFLLAAATYERRLVYVDVTNGEVIANFHTPYENMCMAQNQNNAIIGIGHNGGMISLWTPNTDQPVAKLMKHHPACISMDFDITGTKLAVGHGDGNVQVWDVRNMTRVYQRSKSTPGIKAVRFSATGVMGVARNNYVEFYEKCDKKTAFLTHKYNCNVNSLKFVLFEDIAVVGKDDGISALVVPGTGEPNLDSNVANPYATKEWRQNKEVQDLLDKIPYQTITLNPEALFQVGKTNDVLDQRREKFQKKRMIKVVDADGGVKTEEKKPSKAMTMERKLRMMKEEYNRHLIEEKAARKKKLEETGVDEETAKAGVLARFAKEKKARDI